MASADRDIRDRLRSASRIEPDRLPRLRLIGAEWAEAIARHLKTGHGGIVAVAYEGATTLDADTSDAAVRSPAFLAEARSPSWSGSALVLADGRLADVVIEAVCGGDGRSGASDRPMTLLDRRFVDLALDAVLRAGGETLAQIVPAALSVERLVSTRATEALAAILEEEGRSFVALAFRLKVGRAETELRVALPESVLAPHRRKLTLVPEPAPTIGDEGWARDIQEGLQRTDMRLTALLDEKTITLGDVAGFHVGQTIVLDSHIESLITIECEEQRLFRGRMGRDRDGYVVKIEEKIDPTQEFIDDILSD